MRQLRRGLLALAVIPLALAAAACSKPASAAGPVVTVYKSPTCGCCEDWIDHMREHGFQVEAVDQDNVMPIKEKYGVPRAMSSCHTAVVDGYALEGHVPADVVQRLLKERPPVLGIAVPGMPIGSPGMEQGDRKDPYEVYTFDKNGPVGVYEIR